MIFLEVQGGISAPKGFTANGVVSGIKASGNSDLGLIYSESPAVAAGAFTTNRVRAASVTENENALPGSRFHAIICNSGNANACTGTKGIKDVIKTREATAKELSIDESSVLVASTGIIGEFLPIKKIEEALPNLVKSLSKEGAHNFATAIMTTDTVEKEYAIEVEFSTGKATIGGTTKGAGMIHPNMATMLGFITTDINIPQYTLNSIHKETVNKTFNNLTVDGDTSTNDMVLIMANGDSGVTVESETDIELFEKALFDVYNTLCAKIAEDGE